MWSAKIAVFLESNFVIVASRFVILIPKVILSFYLRICFSEGTQTAGTFLSIP